MLSQEALAERARMSADGVSALERGHRRTPQRETLALLVGALALDGEARRFFVAAAARRKLLPHQKNPSGTSGPWSTTRKSALPLALASFVGREAELPEIGALLGAHRLVTVTGPGGVGKTQIALRVATTLAAASDLAVCLVALAPVRDPALVITTIASAMGLLEVPNHPLLDTVLMHLKTKAVLVILDNCEHVIGEVRVVAETLLLHCPHVRILATSRESLKVAGERAYRLPSLSVPPPATNEISAENAVAYESVGLFVDRALGVNHHFTLTDESAPVVAEICRALDGIPLAIELAAARLNVLSVPALAQRLDDRFRLLARGDRKALPRQQTMRATIDWSYDLLSAAEQRALERLSVFAGGCTFASAATVCNDCEYSDEDLLDVLSSLVDKSLLIIDFDDREPRYRLLASFREYAREKFVQRGERDAAAPSTS